MFCVREAAKNETGSIFGGLTQIYVGNNYDRSCYAKPTLVGTPKENEEK